MTYEFEQMLYLAGETITGKIYDGNIVADIRDIQEKAKQQGIYFCLMSSFVKRRIMPSNEEIIFMSAVAQNIKKRDFIERTIAFLRCNGISCLLLKGDVVSRLYYEPEVRISSDTDILIKPEDEGKTAKLLAEYGFKVDQRSKNDHHFKAYHKTGGIVEVHISLYQKSAKDIIFKNMLDFYEKPYVLPNGIETLGITDGIIYISAHFIKHFIKSGAGIRQIADIVVYMKFFENEIDWNKYNDVMKQLGYSNLINAIKCIGKKYWGIDLEPDICDEGLINDLLNDIETGGVYGLEDAQRRSFFNVISEKMTSMDKDEFKRYKLSNLNGHLYDKIFLPRHHLEKRYPFVRKSPLLIPVANLIRWISIIIEVLKGKRKAQACLYGDNEVNPAVEKRLALMKELGIIE